MNVEGKEKRGEAPKRSSRGSGSAPNRDGRELGFRGTIGKEWERGDEGR